MPSDLGGEADVTLDDIRHLNATSLWIARMEARLDRQREHRCSSGFCGAEDCRSCRPTFPRPTDTTDLALRGLEDEP
jgi:hypothetical protein